MIAAAGLVVFLVLAGCGSGSTSAANVPGNWNVVLTGAGAAEPMYTFGLSIIAGANSLTAQPAPYTGGQAYGNNCADWSDAVATGTANGTLISLTITDGDQLSGRHKRGVHGDQRDVLHSSLYPGQLRLRQSLGRRRFHPAVTRLVLPNHQLTNSG
jgi:hypothetical protein